MIEELRMEMIQAFRIYAEKKPERRDPEWICYVKAREAYLKEAAVETGNIYTPLKMTILPGDH